MALVQRSFSDIITFTRASGGGRFNAQGQYEWLPANTPRIDYDPVTGECRGLLVEESRTNLVTYSSDFANAAWIKLNANVTPDAHGAYLITDTAVNGFHQIGVSLSTTAGVRTYSIDLKYVDCRYVALVPTNQGAAYADNVNRAAVIDLSTMTVNNTLGTGVGVTFSQAADGFTRVGVTVTTNNNAIAGPTLRMLDNNTSAASGYPGTGKSVLIRSAQVETGAFPTSHIPTTTAQVTRAADIASVNKLSPWYNAGAGTFVIKHDAPAGRPLLSSGANVIAVSQGPGKLVVAYDAQGSYVSYNDSSYVSGPALSIEAALDLFKSATSYMGARGQSVRYFPRKLEVSEAA